MSYNLTPGIRSTHLKLLAKRTPLHYRHAAANEGTGWGDTASRIFLRAVHCAVLEPSVFASTYEICPHKRGALETPSGKPTKYGLWQQSRPGKLALSVGEATSIRAIVVSLRAHPDAARILWGPGWSEVERTWVDQPSGLTCKLKADRLIMATLPGSETRMIEMSQGHPPLHCEIWDLKTLGDASEHEVRWMLKKLRVPLQLAHYRAGMQARGAVVTRCGVVVVEDRAPHDVGVYVLDTGDLDDAEEQRQDLLARVAECERNDSWPGACPEMTTLPLDPEDLGDIDTDDEEI
jgi:hypothetical protein